MTLQELLAFAGRHPLMSAALAGLTLAIIGNEIAQLFKGFRSIGPAELTGLVNAEQALVVDLRAPGDFAKGHIAGSRNVQMSQFDPENKQLKPARELPVVLVCNAGITATGAAKRLRKAGFTRVHLLEGGIQKWQADGLPLVKGRA